MPFPPQFYLYCPHNSFMTSTSITARYRVLGHNDSSAHQSYICTALSGNMDYFIQNAFSVLSLKTQVKPELIYTV